MGIFSGLGATTKSVLSLGGALISAGGLTGLAYNAPTILWKNGVICRDIAYLAEVTEEKDLSSGLWIPTRNGFVDSKKVESDGATCWKT